MTPSPKLTIGQRAVIDLVARGWTNAEIARELRVSRARVGQIVDAIATKLPGPGKPRRRILEHLVREPSRRTA